MKKILAVVLVIMLLLSLGACSSRKTNTVEVKTVSAEISTPDEVIDTKKYSDDLRGLCDYLADKNCIYNLPESTKDEFSDPIKMEASLIGADEGYKFTCKRDDGTVVIELYSYSNTDNKWYQQAVNEGKITISTEIENGTFDAIVSANGKYVMIYSDSSNRAELREATIELFNSFDIR